MKIVVSCGDINGIGIEAFMKALPMFYAEKDNSDCELTLAVNRKSLLDYTEKSGFDIKVEHSFFQYKSFRVKLLDCESYAAVNLGIADKKSGFLAIESLDRAVSAVKSKEYGAVLTLPVAKDVMKAAGWNFIGHTQYLADSCGKVQPLMILFKDNLRVAVVTDHIPLMDVARYLAETNLPESTADIFNKSLKVDFAIDTPKIAVMSINPHGGENGEIGTEEVDFLKKKIEKIRESNIIAEGPKAADGFFGFGEYKHYDGILAMYHDQGLIPIKLLANGGGVNFTAGLPIVRTSPDHGTAFSIAGQGKANPQSTYDALVWAKKISENRRLNHCPS
jgi:4-hydroxythreonine-4-phosphate dehydrogenase